MKVLAISSCAMPFFFTSCFNSDKSKKEITVPDNREATIQYFSGEQVAIFSGFLFKNIPDIRRLKVENNFTLGLSTFQSSVINFNLEQQTFDVRVICNNAWPTTISGNLSFFYDGKPIEIKDESQTPFVIKIVEKPSITFTGERTQTVALSTIGGGHCEFKGFTAFNMKDIKDQLEIKTTLAQTGTTIILQPHFNDDSTFSIDFYFASAKTERITGVFMFYYKGQLLNNTPKDLITINFVKKGQILAPQITNYDVCLQNQKAEITLKGLIFSELNQEDVKVTLEVTSALEFVKLENYEITNWNDKYHSFDIHVPILEEKSEIWDFDFTISFENPTTGEKIPFECKPIHVGVTNSIPTNWFSISTVEDKKVLAGIADEYKDRVKDSLMKITTLRIPDYVDEIDANAFSGMTDSEYPSLTKLVFPTGCALRAIHENAFNGSTCFKCPLVLPNNIATIGDGAFETATNFETLTFSNLGGKVTIGKNAFRRISFKGDLTLPYDTTVEQYAFNSSYFDGTLTIPAKINTYFDFANLIYISTIDLTKYAQKPYWIGNDYVYQLTNIGDGLDSSANRIVYYGKGLVPWIQDIIADMQHHGLPKKFVFKLKTEN